MSRVDQLTMEELIDRCGVEGVAELLMVACLNHLEKVKLDTNDEETIRLYEYRVAVTRKLVRDMKL